MRATDYVVQRPGWPLGEHLGFESQSLYLHV
jgi:hypothetical protein